MTLKIILWAVVLYYLYKFVFGVVVPVSKATQQMKGTMRQMQEEQQRQQQAFNQQHQSSQVPKQETTKGNTADKGDYIEFEEIK
jgi:Sec-independent protein translocase protein TatA